LKLTEKAIGDLECPPGRKDMLVFDDSLPGLAVRVSAKGKTFLAQYTLDGTRRRVPIGRWGAVTLESARSAAKGILGDVAKGNDVASDRAAARKKKAEEAAAAKMTLEKLIQEWESLGLGNARKSHRVNAPRAIRNAFAKELKEPASTLPRRRAVEVLDAIVESGRPTMAARTLAYGRACYSWGKKRGKVDANPFAGLPISTASVSRDRVLSNFEVSVIWKAAPRLGWPFGPLFQILLLSVQRRDEVAGMRWSELSADLTIWTIPKERAKNRRSHIVHLAPAAVALLEKAPRFLIKEDGEEKQSDFVFTTTGKTPASGISKAKARLEEKAAELWKGAEPMPHWQLHDFRRTAVTWLAGAGVPPHVCDRLLNHVTGSIQGVAAVYQRQEFLAERKAALEKWAEHVAGESNNGGSKAG
jgi:integrase